MIVCAALLLVVAPAVLATKVPGCNEYSNNGVFNEFGPLPTKLYDSRFYYQVLLSGKPFTSFDSKKSLKGYFFEYLEFREQRGVGDGVFSYYKVLFNDGHQYRVIDYVRVDPVKYDKLEDAILFADETPAGDKKIKMQFLLSDCTCTMRTYDLNMNDIVSQASTSTCQDQRQAPTYQHSIHQPTSNEIRFTNDIHLMGANDLLPLCDTNDNNGVMNEFGPLPSALRDSSLFRRVASPGYSSNTLELTGRMSRYKVEYNEYMSVYGTGSDLFGYLTIYHLDSVAYTYKVLDYLRVDINRWKNIQQAILQADYQADMNRLIGIKYSTSDCKCVQRMYNLKSGDIVASATSSACNGDPIRTPPHSVTQQAKSISGKTDITRMGLTDLYSGCVTSDNVGVLDVFGALPTDLYNVYYYYEVVSTGYYNTKFRMKYPLDMYGMVYSRFKDQLTASKTYAVINLYYYESGVPKLLDYLRVNPDKWELAQIGLLQADTKPDRFRKLRVRYLTADCRCKMREYDLEAVDIVGAAITKTCDGLAHAGTTPTQTVVQEQASLERLGKANYNRWSLSA